MKRSIWLSGIFVALAIATACVLTKINSGVPNNKCYNNGYMNLMPRQKITPSVETIGGLKVDLGSIKDVDLKSLDARVSSIERCVLSVKAENPNPTDEQLNKWDVSRETYKNISKLNKSCIIIKIVEPYKLSKDGKWQLLNAPAPVELCAAKRLDVSEGKCYWRSVVQDDNVLITPPNIYLWDLVRIMGVNGLWFSPFAKCGLL